MLVLLLGPLPAAPVLAAVPAALAAALEPEAALGLLAALRLVAVMQLDLCLLPGNARQSAVRKQQAAPAVSLSQAFPPLFLIPPYP